jgi:hypothetical protein
MLGAFSFSDSLRRSTSIYNDKPKRQKTRPHKKTIDRSDEDKVTRTRTRQAITCENREGRRQDETRQGKTRHDTT